MWNRLLLSAFAALLILSQDVTAVELRFKSGPWTGHVNLEKTGCIMLSPFSDNQASLVVKMLKPDDISIGIYWHKQRFDNLVDKEISGRVIIDRQPPVDLTGEFIRNDYLRLSSPNVGLLKHVFTAGSEGRLEYGNLGWATFGLRGSSRAVDELYGCWRTRLAESKESPASNTVALKKMNAFFNSNDEAKTAQLDATECSLEEAHECISHSINCSPEIPLAFYITGGENPDRVIDNIRSIANSKFRNDSIEVFLDSGRVRVGLSTWDVSLMYNEMDGVWDLILKADQTDVNNFFSAINQNQYGDAYFAINGNQYTLSHLDTSKNFPFLLIF